VSDEEERALLQETDPRFHPHLLLSTHTGIRMSEQHSLGSPQVDFTLQQLCLPRTKNGDSQDAPLNRTALDAFGRLKTEADGEFVLPDAESP
jgi:hypothetical protein